MAETTRKINQIAFRSGHLYGGPYFWSLITSFRYYGHAFKYVYRNPVRGKLCEQVEEYEYSTLRGILGLQHLPFPISYTACGMELNLPDLDESDQWLSWLNRPFPKEAEEMIRSLFRKKKIDRILCRETRLPDPMLEELL